MRRMCLVLSVETVAVVFTSALCQAGRSTTRMARVLCLRANATNLANNAVRLCRKPWEKTIAKTALRSGGDTPFDGP